MNTQNNNKKGRYIHGQKDNILNISLIFVSSSPYSVAFFVK